MEAVRSPGNNLTCRARHLARRGLQMREVLFAFLGAQVPDMRAAFGMTLAAMRRLAFSLWCNLKVVSHHIS